MKTYLELFESDGLTRSEWRTAQHVSTEQWYQTYRPWIRCIDSQRAREASYIVGCGEIPEDDSCKDGT